MSDNAEREKILQKIRNLAAVADPASGAFQGEMENAAKLMQKLMDQHAVQWSEIFLNKSEQERSDLFGQCTGKILLGTVKVWHWMLARLIARITHTKHYVTSGYGPTARDPHKNHRGKYMSFFGTLSNAQAACNLYDDWVVILDDMAKKASSVYCKELTKKYGVKNPIQHFSQIIYEADLLGDYLTMDQDHPNVWRHSWLMGMIDGIRDALTKAEEERTEETSKVLVVLDKELLGAYFGDLTRGPRVVTDETKKEMKKILAEIQVGKQIDITSKRIK